MGNHTLPPSQDWIFWEQNQWVVQRLMEKAEKLCSLHKYMGDFVYDFVQSLLSKPSTSWSSRSLKGKEIQKLLVEFFIDMALTDLRLFSWSGFKQKQTKPMKQVYQDNRMDPPPRLAVTGPWTRCFPVKVHFLLAYFPLLRPKANVFTQTFSMPFCGSCRKETKACLSITLSKFF